MFELIAGMEIGVVGAAGVPHLPEDLQPALAEGTQSTSVGFAAGAQGLIIEGRPGRGGSTEVGPQMDSGPQRLVAVPPQIDFVDLTGLVANRSSPGQSL